MWYQILHGHVSLLSLYPRDRNAKWQICFQNGERLRFLRLPLNFSLVHFSCATLIHNGKSQAKVLMLRRESLGERVQFLLELVLKLVKNPPAMWETWVRSLGWVNPLEKGKATLLPIFWPGEFHGLYNPWGCKESDTTERLSF